MPIGIIAEYNPFHNGHEYHIAQSRRITGDDCVVAVMSGGFVQRGDAAICDKWARTRMALACGCDLVVELPVGYCVQSAERFARGAIAILNALNVTSTAFGAECADISILSDVVQVLTEEPRWYREKLAGGLAEGLNFPTARARALGDLGEIISTPNNILAVEYLRAGAKNPIAVQRVGAAHDGVDTHDGFASASQIRALILSGYLDSVRDFMPSPAYDILLKEIRDGRAPTTLAPLEPALIAHLRKISPNELATAPDVSEGLENRLIAAARKFGTLPQIIEAANTRRYTLPRLRRAIINSFLGLSAPDESPQYIRVLGANERGRRVLDCSQLPVVTKAARANRELLQQDALATDLFALLFPSETERAAGQDFTKSPIMI